MGRSSEGLLTLNHEREMSLSILKKQNYIFQPFIRGEIIVVDVLRSLNSKRISYVARQELLRTSNGLGLTVEIVQDEKLAPIIEQFGSIIDFEGCINLEFIKSQSAYFLMDVNPRFSAGIVFSNIAGFNFVENHVLNFLGQKIQHVRSEKIKYGTIITRKYIEALS